MSTTEASLLATSSGTTVSLYLLGAHCDANKLVPFQYNKTEVEFRAYAVTVDGPSGSPKHRKK